MTGELGEYPLKCLLISQYTYVASILTLGDHQIEKAQTAINNYIMDKTEAKRNWLSKDRIYQPIKKRRV